MAPTSIAAIPTTASSTPAATYCSDEPYIPQVILIAIPICSTIICIIVTLIAYNISKIRLLTRLRAELPEHRDEFILQQCKRCGLDLDVDPKNISKFYGGSGGERLSPFHTPGRCA
jgi:hypothetical protein